MQMTTFSSAIPRNVRQLEFECIAANGSAVLAAAWLHLTM